MRDFTFKYNPNRVSKCPICGGKGNHYAEIEGTALRWCWQPPVVAPRGYRETKHPNIFIDESQFEPEYNRPKQVEERKNHTSPNLASPPMRDIVYRAQLRQFSLSGKDRRSILDRGFSPEQIERVPFKTLNSGTRWGLVEPIAQAFNDQLDGIPGFYRNKYDKWTLAGGSGLLIPVENVDGNLIALQIRPHNTNKNEESDKPKYIWVSSRKKKCGTASGAPAGVVYPEGQHKNNHSSRVIYTEGFFKALAAAEKFKCPVVWVAGVHQWRSAIEPLAALNPNEIQIAFDMDLFDNRHVQSALVQSITAFGHMLGSQIRTIHWNPLLGKGIDDAILKGGLAETDLQFLSFDEILSELTPPAKLPNTKYLRINDDFSLTPPKEEETPKKEECWTATERAVINALQAPFGTISFITAGTGYGKSTALCRNIQKNTLVVAKNYDDSGEQLRKDFEEYGIHIEWHYGKQLPAERLPKNAPKSRLERSKEAYCKDFSRAVRATRSGHNGCKGCPFFTVTDEEGEKWYGCGYRKHLDDLRFSPFYGMAIPEVALQENILERYETIVFDDIANLLQNLANQRVINIEDIATWQVKSEDMPPSFTDFLNSLREELSKAQLEPIGISKQLRKEAKAALRAIKEIEQSPLPCEEKFQEAGQWHYPKAWVKDLLDAMAKGLPIDLRAGQLTFWTGRPEVLKILRKKRIVILDATPDLTVWKGLLGPSLKFSINIPKLPKAEPRIIQVPDVLGSKKQIERLAPHILNLAKRENAFIITRAGECVGKLDADGWLGRHERGLNHLQNYDAGILAGHLSLPPDEARNMAQGIRALARRLNVPDPVVEEIECDENGRAWATYYDKSRRYTGLQRYTALNKDSLAAHIARHHHTSAVIQTWGRNRGPKILYLIDGMPLYSPDPNNPIWITVMTLRELGLDPAETRGNPKLDKANELVSKAARLRVERGVEIWAQYVKFQLSTPSIRQLRESLGTDGRLSSVPCAKRVKERLEAVLEEHIKENQNFTRVVADVSPNTLEYSEPLSDTPQYHSGKTSKEKEKIAIELSFEDDQEALIPTESPVKQPNHIGIEEPPHNVFPGNRRDSEESPPTDGDLGDIRNTPYAIWPETVLKEFEEEDWEDEKPDKGS
ncbi:MAG: DUF3854 domain-containing protein [Bacteroidota bacterium]